MNSQYAYRRFVGFAVALGLVVGMPWSTRTASGQVLFDDEFDGTHGNTAFHPGGVVDVTAYRAPFGGTTGDDFVGRTNFRFTLPQDGVATAAPGSTDGKVAVLNLDTYNPNAAGQTFLGTDLISKTNYAVGGGFSMTTRMRLQAGTPAGIVAAPFLYDVERENPVGTLVRDEIDHEILSNNAQSAAPDNTLTNVWNDGNFASAGAPVTISNPAGFDVTQFHDYRVDWTPTSVKWYIDNSLVRTETSVVPDDPMRAHINVWAPDSTFAAAYNAALQPSATSPGTAYKVEVDRMQISRTNTTVTNNLLADGSFEGFNHPIDGNGGWSIFNNASATSGEVTPQDGFAALKAFGPFQGSTNASGAFQNVPAAPGQQFEGSVWAYSPSFDSISGKQNYTNITLSFVNSAGAVIGSVNFSPGTNEKNTPIFDGRDTNMTATQDQWIQYSVDAVAPAGTAFVRESLFFIQLYHGGVGDNGAVWFDNASLVSLTPQVVAVPGDYNGNGVVDAADYVVWRANVGQSTLANRGTGITGLVGAADYNFWRSHFGSTSGSGSALGSAAIPEPCSWMMAMFGVAFVIAKRRRS
ncbi:MAG TPA: glycoside hydrolase family 16 protein [Lacipirellulaceae bacterium]|jgi:hypothetical protein|nr:glycoside hydrolase family 16 protein [Lacipirellulaceae bacterium]